MELNIGEILDQLGTNVSADTLTKGSAISIVSLVVMGVLGILMCFLGLKLIRVWNILSGFAIGAVIGAAASWMLKLNGMAVLGVIAGSAVVLGVLAGIFKKFGVFIYSFATIAVLSVQILQPENWIFVAVCGAVGLIFAIIAMLMFEPLVIIITSMNGGNMVGTAITAFAGITNIYIVWGIVAVAALIGMAAQFVVRSKEIAKKEMQHANVVKEEISKSQKVEQLRSMLDDEDDE